MDLFSVRLLFNSHSILCDVVTATSFHSAIRAPRKGQVDADFDGWARHARCHRTRALSSQAIERQSSRYDFAGLAF